MKLHGKKIEGANVEYVVIPRQSGDLVFKATAVLDMSKFDELCPTPKPGKKVIQGGRVVDDFQDKDYLIELEQYGEKRWAFLILETFRHTEGLEWETVNYDDPNTWLNYEAELRNAGFTKSEITLLVTGMTNANSLNQAKIDEAKNRFLVSLTQTKEQ